ncbi:MAG: serine hydrolase [Bacteroidetes bacterium]|nr:MAG: serine hydrolase [Bacteroidota bacterium]
MKKHTLISILTFLLFGIIFNVQCSHVHKQSKPASSQAPYKEMDEQIAKYVADNHIPGIAYGVVKGNQMIWSGAAGWANIEQKTPMSIDGIINIASISKTFTATAVMQLWEKGMLSLETDVNEYLPTPIRNPHHPDVPITIFQLLTHTSSIADGESYGASYASGDPIVSLEEWIQNYLIPEGRYYDAASNFHSWKPGIGNDYSNVGFGLLGYIVEQVANTPFNLYCKTHILDPLGMDNSGWFLYEIDTLKHITPYEDQHPLSLYSFPNYPDGLLRTSVRELSYFLLAMINGGEYNNVRILKESTLKIMLKAQIEEDRSQGLCWGMIGFKSLWGHSGGDPGVGTYMYFSPKTKIGVITFQNNHNGDLLGVFRRLYNTAEE